nr:MAG TPA: hypothetical protein [Caudoviricetes sp.]
MKILRTLFIYKFSEKSHISLFILATHHSPSNDKNNKKTLI